MADPMTLSHPRQKTAGWEFLQAFDRGLGHPMHFPTTHPPMSTKKKHRTALMAPEEEAASGEQNQRIGIGQ